MQLNGESIVESLVEELSRLSGPRAGWTVQDEVYTFFRMRGYECERNIPASYASESTGEIRQGRIAMLVRDPEHTHPDIALEIGTRSRSIRKLLQFEGVVRMLVVPGGSGPVELPPGIHFSRNR